MGSFANLADGHLCRLHSWRVRRVSLFVVLGPLTLPGAPALTLSGRGAGLPKSGPQASKSTEGEAARASSGTASPLPWSVVKAGLRSSLEPRG